VPISSARLAVLNKLLIVMGFILRFPLEVFLKLVPFRPQCENG
jgi:hypothetical protein